MAAQSFVFVQEKTVAVFDVAAVVRSGTGSESDGPASSPNNPAVAMATASGRGGGCLRDVFGARLMALPVQAAKGRESPVPKEEPATS